MNEDQTQTSSSIEQKLRDYQRLVNEYASVLNLSSPKMLEEFSVGIERSLAFSEFLEVGQRVLDVGSGVGLPGIPLAISRSDLKIVLCEVRVKRAAFLERVVGALGLPNVTVYNADVQNISERVDVVTALWVGSLSKLYGLSRHLFERHWTLLTRKGNEVQGELETLKHQANVRMFHVKPLPDGANLVLVQGEQ